MRRWNIAHHILIVAFMSCVLPESGRADSAQVLKEITDTASTLCGYVTQGGSKSTIEIKGDVKAELNGLVKRLADLGISGNGTVLDEKYEGIVQEQLAGTLKDIRQCRVSIFDTLQKKLIPDISQQPAFDTEGQITQAGIKVGRTFGARRLPNDATSFEFAEIMNCGNFNTGQPFYYNGIRLLFIRERTSVMVEAGRVQDSPIRYGVLARVIE